MLAPGSARRGSIAILLLFCVGGVQGCGGESDEGGEGNQPGQGSGAAPVSGPIEEGEFVQRFGSYACAGLEVCCTEAGVPYDPTFCAALVSAPANAGNPQVTYDPNAAADCLNEVQNADIVCEGGVETPACNRVYSGSSMPGDACTDDTECAIVDGAEVECDPFDEVCTTTRRGNSGEACTSSCEELPPNGFVCSGTSNADLSEHEDVQCYREDGLVCNAGTCTPLAPLGGACSFDTDCEASGYCNGADGVCAARAQVGESCGDALCVDGAYCDDASTCQSSGSEGEQCLSSEECVGGDCSAGVCGPDNPFGALGDALIGLLCGGGFTTE